jgi:hypothetical protein
MRQVPSPQRPSSRALLLAGLEALALGIAGQAFAACFTVNPNYNHPSADGTVFSATVSVPAGCTLSSLGSSNAWLTFSVTAINLIARPWTYLLQGTVAANLGCPALPRGAVIRASSEAVYTVYQDGFNQRIQPETESFGPGAGSGSVEVMAGNATCPSYCATANASWIHLQGAACTTAFHAVLPYSIDANTSCTGRSGNITVLGKSLSVYQAAGTAAPSLSPTSASIGASGVSGQFTVNIGDSCTWSASSNATWLRVTGGSSGSGTGTVLFQADTNTGCAGRQGTITAAGKTFTLSQAAGTGTFSLSPGTVSPPAAAGSTAVTVNATPGCPWTASSNAAWLSVSPTSGTGPGTPGVSWGENTGPARTGTVTIAGQTFTVNQSGAQAPVCTSFSISPAVLNVPSPAGSQAVTVTGSPASCGGGSWAATSGADWLTVSPRNGLGSGAVSVSWTENASSRRSATATIAGQTLSVDQGSPGSAACTPGSTAACILGNRFRVSAQYTDYAGNAGVGQAVKLTSDAAYFWFFDAANVEVFAKMVDFCGGGGNVAVYGNGLTDLGVKITVQDTATGRTKDYSNPLGGRFRLIRDGPFSCSPDAVAAAEDRWAPVPEPLPKPGGSQIRRTVAIGEASGTCTPDATSLCLLESRFRVTAAYRTYGGDFGAAQAASLTSDTGTFWFLGPDNVEVVAKMVSFCEGGRGNVAVYANGLTDLEVALTITDTKTGLAVTYANPLGTPFELIREGPFSCQP